MKVYMIEVGRIYSLSSDLTLASDKLNFLLGGSLLKVSCDRYNVISCHMFAAKEKTLIMESLHLKKGGLILYL